jgi:hypothetical protein
MEAAKHKAIHPGVQAGACRLVARKSEPPSTRGPLHCRSDRVWSTCVESTTRC